MPFPPSDRLLDLARKAVAGERLDDEAQDFVFDEIGLSTEAQLAALALARGWVPKPEVCGEDLPFNDPPITAVQRAYLEAFDRCLRARDDEPELEQASRARRRAVDWVMLEAADRRARGEFPELDARDEAEASERMAA